MAYYQVLDVPAGTYEYEPSFFEMNVKPTLNAFDKTTRRRGIEKAIKQQGLTPEYKMDSEGKYSASYSQPRQKKSINQLVDSDALIKSVKDRQADGTPLNVILAGLNELERKILGLSSSPTDENKFFAENYALSQTGLSMDPGYKEGDSFLNKLFASTSAFGGGLFKGGAMDETTQTVISNIKTVEDLANLLSDEEAVRQINLEEIKKYYGEEMFNKALAYAQEQ